MMFHRIVKTCIVYALGIEARYIVRKYKPHIVAVTGSVGKTSTKDAIYAVLAGSHHVRKSDKSFNSELGLPLTIIGVPNAWNNPLRWIQNLIDGLFLILFRTPYPEWLVLEVGADRRGDIISLASWLPVDIAVITRLPEVPVHVEFFDSPAEVVEEKASLINAIKKGGVLVVYADDHRKDMLAERARERGVEVVTFGLSEGSDVRAHDITPVFEEGDPPAGGRPVGVSSKITIGHETVPVTTAGTLGSHMVLPLAAATAVGAAVGESVQEMAQGLARYQAPLGRMHVLAGIKDTLVIDDTYNSSPAAVTAALDTLSSIFEQGKADRSAGRRIAVLGDMLELGRHSVEEHRKIGAHAAKTVDVLCTVGFRARDMADGALNNGLNDSNIFQYEDADKAGDELASMLQPGDVILVKGSQSMRMEKTVEHLMKDPTLAPRLLVRQELNWKNR